MFPKVTPLVKNILIINVLMFIALMVFKDRWFMIMAGFFPLSENFAPWQPVTSMFMHGGFSHILFNMFGVFIFGSTLERVWGPKRFLIFYMFTGLGAYALHFGIVYFQFYQAQEVINSAIESGIISADMLNARNDINDYPEVLEAIRNYKGYLNSTVVGASGALFGLLFAFGYLFPNTNLYLLFFPFPIKAKYFVIGYGLIELYMAFNNSPGDNVAHFAHLGGMLFGFILLKKWQKDQNNFY